MSDGRCIVYCTALLLTVSVGHRVTDCCAGCRPDDTDIQNATYADRVGLGCCCCRHHPSDDPLSFQVLDVIATCMHRVAWNHYHSDMSRVFEDVVQVPSMLLVSADQKIINCEENALKYRRDLLSRDFLEIAYARCPAAAAIAIIMEAESAILSSWPYNFWSLDQRVFGGALASAISSMTALPVYTSRFQHHPQRLSWPVEAGLSRINVLMSLITAGARPDRIWYEDIHLLGPYQYFVVAPTLPKAIWNFHDPGPSERDRPSFATTQEALWDMVASFNDINATFFPVKGTLIGLLRYGATIGSLPNNKWDIVDNDLDFWVETTFLDWPVFCFKFTSELLRRGWRACHLQMDEVGASPLRAPRILVCDRSDPFFIAEVFPFEHSRGHLGDVKVCSSLHTGSLPSGLGLEYHDGQQCRHPIESLWIEESIVFPLSWCKAFGVRVPCPQKPIAFLRATGHGPCLAFPIIFPTRDCTHPENQRLQSEWSLADAEHIKEVGKTLMVEGFASFGEEDWQRCVNHSIVNKSWFDNCLQTYSFESR